MLCTSLVASVGAHGIYQDYNTDGWSQPAIAALMQGMANHVYPWNGTGAGNAPTKQPGTEGLPGPVTGQDGLTAAGQKGSAGVGSFSGQTKDANPGGSYGQDGDGVPGSTHGQAEDGFPGNLYGQADGAAAQPDIGSTPQPEPTQYEFTQVTQEYFDDALLIGDSRAEGVALYSGWDNLAYYTEGGMTIYNMFQRPAATGDGQKLTIEEALETQTFGKIYLEIGINEMGTGTVDSFMEAYEGAVLRLRELQPGAILYLCGIMYVKQSKSESDPIFNNPNIQERNDRISQLADGENIFYLDINELVADGTGNLNPDYTWDEVHLLGKYDSLWLDYFCSHGIVKTAEGNALN